MPQYTNRDLPGQAGWRERKLPQGPNLDPNYQPSPLANMFEPQGPPAPDPVAAARAFVGPNATPKMGEQRTQDGVTGEWNGATWKKVQADPNAQSHLYDSPAMATAGSLMDTAGKTAKGLLHSPLDAIKGLLSTPGQIVEGYKQIPNLIRDPSLLGEAGGAIKAGVKAIGDDPEMGGSLIGQIGLGHLAAPHAPAAVRGLGEAAGKGLSAAGRGFEVAGEAASKHAPMAGAAAMGTGNIVGGAGIMAAPSIMKAAGAGLRKAGGFFERAPEAPILDQFKANVSGYDPSGGFGEGADPMFSGPPAPTGPGPMSPRPAPKGGMTNDLNSVLEGLRHADTANDVPESVSGPSGPTITDSGPEANVGGMRRGRDASGSKMEFNEDPGTWRSSGRPAVGSDFYSQAVDALNPPADFNWPEAGGDYVRDAEGSTVRAPNAVPPSFEMPESWQPFVQPEAAPEPGLAPGSFAGDRAVPPMRDMPELPAGGLDSLTPDVLAGLRRALEVGNDQMMPEPQTPGPTYENKSPQRANLDDMLRALRAKGTI